MMPTLKTATLLRNLVSRHSICMTIFALLDCEANAFNRGSALRRALLRLVRDALVKKVHALFEGLCKQMVLSRNKDFDLFLQQLQVRRECAREPVKSMFFRIPARWLTKS